MTERTFLVVTHKPGVLATFSTFHGTQDLGIGVDPDTADQTLWWMSQDWAAQVLAAGVPLPQLLAPPPGFVAGLDRKWLNRDVGTLRKIDVPKFFVKHPDYLTEHPQVVVSVPGEHTELLTPHVMLAEDLAEGDFSDFEAVPSDALIQLDAMLPCVVEARHWVAHGEVTASCPYRLGMVGWDSNLFLEMLFNAQGQELTAAMDAVARELAADIDAPPGYAIDLGATVTGEVTVLRAWPAWSAEPLHADPAGVFRALVAAHDFDHDAEQWRWTPDLRLYARASSTPQPEEPSDAERETVHA